MLARSKGELHIKDMKTDQVFKLCNVTTRSFGLCCFEEVGLFYIKNEANGRYGYNRIEFYDVYTQQKVYERVYNQNKDCWSPFSNYAILNWNTGEHVIYNRKKKNFYSRFISCQDPTSHLRNPPDKACLFTSSKRIDGRRCFERCGRHRNSFFFDYTQAKLCSPKLYRWNAVC
ncbi:unnamed protein product [Bursaphelenchus okinawaensis]|uniref:Uncharacterized protein n=1 Tax=Bursaphelenchus okinawaensis TaxID=465554 RepID=A0A811LDM5_9BILA|nr:unnamed protein product [Bursaphelenchus okinawaensis]CAG9123346.1 unnamed protein product [Bursaphelenchus okinawaensis]